MSLRSRRLELALSLMIATGVCLAPEVASANGDVAISREKEAVLAIEESQQTPPAEPGALVEQPKDKTVSAVDEPVESSEDTGAAVDKDAAASKETTQPIDAQKKTDAEKLDIAPEKDAAETAKEMKPEMAISRTDQKEQSAKSPKLSMTEERSYRVVVSFEDKTTKQLKASKYQWTLARGRNEVPNDWAKFPSQYLGGELSEWKTVHTTHNKSNEDFPSVPFFKNIKTRIEVVDGKPSVVLTFDNAKLFGFDGLDIRDRAVVRSGMMDYVGTYRLSLIMDGTAVASEKLELRPYDDFRTQEEIDKELPVAVKEAKVNGIYAKVQKIGKSAQNRPINAVFVAESEKDLKDYQALKARIAKDPEGVLKELRAGTLKYKVPVMYSNIHADEIVGVDAVMEFLRDLTMNKPFEYRTIKGLTEEGKKELKIEMDKDRAVWSELIKDKVTGVGYLRGNGGISNGHNYDGGFDASADLSEEDFKKYYDTQMKIFDPREILSKMFFILVPSENVDARVVNSRTNGNGFDLNRDNTYQTQPETQAMTKLISDWSPLSLHEFHGYYQYYQVEPCSPTHDPNNEYDLFIETAMAQGEAFAGASIANNRTMNSAKIPMRDYLLRQEDGSRFWEVPFDDMSTSYTPQYAMMHGTNAFTVESAYATADAVKALEYGQIGNADFIFANREKMFENQLLRFVRGIKNIDAMETRPFYVDQADRMGAEASVFRPNNNENQNFFPEYYVIPMDAMNQEDRPAAQETIALLLRNDVKLDQLTKDVKIGGKLYKKGTIIVNMHQAKRNMANAVLYPNLVIDDWSQYSLYSEPVTNFSQLRGFDMDTIRKVGVFDGLLQPIAAAPAVKTVIKGHGIVSIVKNNSIEAIRAINAMLGAKEKVGFVVEGQNKGDFVMATSVLNRLKDRFALDVIQSNKAPKAKLINPAIKLFVPTASNAVQIKDRDGNLIGMIGYDNRLNTNGNWDFFALREQMGFNLTDNLGLASVVVGSQYPSNADAVAAKIAAGTPYVGYTTDALQFVKDLKLADLKFKLEGDWAGFDALSMVHYPTDDLATATYMNEEDYIMYGFGGDYFIEAPDGSKVLIQTLRDQDLLEGFMTKEYMKDYKGSVQAILLEKDGKTLRLFANTLTNKAHQSDDYRYLANSIYAEAFSINGLSRRQNPAQTRIRRGAVRMRKVKLASRAWRRRRGMPESSAIS